MKCSLLLLGFYAAANAFLMPERSPSLENIIREDDKLAFPSHDAKEKAVQILDLFNIPHDKINANESNCIFLLTIFLDSFAFPTKISLKEEIEKLCNEIKVDNLRNSLKTLSTSFVNRFYKSYVGASAVKWLVSVIQEMADHGNAIRGANVISVHEFKHPWKQTSVIVKFIGKRNAGPIIISSHIDSISRGNNPETMVAPGADDDGSGSMTVLEVLRILTSESSFNPINPVEIHFYSAEEAGLLGSREVAKEYKRLGIPVIAMLQVEMDGYTGLQANSVGIMTDNTSKPLTDFIRLIVKEFTTLIPRDTACGYQCSDHASWYNEGYNSSLVAEAEVKYSNPSMHSVNDTYEKLNYRHMSQFASIGLAFVYQLSYFVN